MSIKCRVGLHRFEPWRKVSMWGPDLPDGAFVYERRCLNGCGTTQSRGTPTAPLDERTVLQRSAMGIRAADPEFVDRHGWAHIDCHACRDVIYDGRLIDTEDTEALQQMHRANCNAGASP
jgi:hypothetical protein